VIFFKPQAQSRPIAAAILAGFLCLSSLTGCNEKEIIEESVEAEVAPSIEPDSLSVEIEAATGAPTKVVWMHYTKTSTSDVYGNFEQFELWGIDTADNLGARKILDGKGSYSRPLITPNGKSIVFTDKHTARDGSNKVFQPEIFRVDWDGGNLERLGEGYAVDIWRDPESKIQWVYTANLGPTDQSNLYADKVERFQLIDPMDRELVFAGVKKVSPDNIQLSRDGKRMSCLFPWPKVGVVDLESGERWQNQHGCWPSMAPDNSYAAWVFDGSHKSVHIFGDRGVKHSQVTVNDAPGVDGYEMYHPRWSNHPRFFAITGPFKGKTIGDGGHSAEIYLGKFSAGLKKVETWVRVTEDGFGDFFPDVWIKGGDAASLESSLFNDAEVPPSDQLKKTEWPSQPKDLLFVWENGSPNGQRIADARGDHQGHECSVIAHDRARFGRHFEMIADGGHFEIDGESMVLLDQRLDGSDAKRGGGFSVEAWITPESTGDGVIVSHPKFQLRQNEGEFRFAALAPRPATMSLGPIVPGEPVHLALSLDDEGWWIFRDGKGRTDKTAVLSAEPMASRRGTTIGGGWNGRIEGLAIYDRSLSAEEVAVNHAHFKQLEAQRAKATVPAIELKAKLLETTELRSVEDLEYSRALICSRYEVVEVVDGELAEKEIAVFHWAVMDRKALSGIPDEIGKVYELKIEPYAEHPEIVSELRWSDFFEEGYELFYDVDPPAPFADSATPR